jgi:NMD protein affecting ribosome stability and mRNA decay
MPKFDAYKCDKCGAPIKLGNYTLVHIEYVATTPQVKQHRMLAKVICDHKGCGYGNPRVLEW